MSDKTTSKHQIINLFNFNLIDLMGKTDQRLSGKFVIISNNGNLNLVYGPLSEFGYHANLVSRFCDINCIASGWENRPDVFTIFDKDYRIRGGGWFEFKFFDKELKIFSHSTAYGSFKKQDILDVVADNDDFSDFELIIP